MTLTAHPWCGIYVSPKYDHSPLVPIHVIKSTSLQKIDCEVPNCRKCMQIAWSSGNPGKECWHLERTSKAKPYIKSAVLTSTSLQDMLSRGLLSSEWGDKCAELNTAAIKCGVDSVFPVENGEHSQHWHFFQYPPMKPTTGVSLGGPGSHLIQWPGSGTVYVKEPEDLIVASIVWWECGGFSRSPQAP